MALTAGEVLLKLLDGTQMKATTLNPLKASVGETLEFTVRNNKDGPLLLETQVQSLGNSSDSPEISKILNSLQLKINNQNLDIVQSILKSNLDVSKNLVEEVIKALNDYKKDNLTIQKAIFLLENNVPITKDHVESLNNFLSKHINIGESLNNLSQILSTLPKDQLHELSTQLKFLEAFQEIPKLLFSISALDISEISQKKDPFSTYENQTFSSLETHQGNFPLIESLVSQDNLSSLNHNLNQSEKLITTLLSIVEEESNSFINTASKDSILSLLEKIVSQEYPLLPDSSDKQFKDLETLIKNNERMDANQETFKTNQSIEKNTFQTSSQTTLENFFTTKDIIQNLFEDSFINTDDPSSLKEMDIKNIYVKISQKLSLIKNFIQNSDSTEAQKIFSSISSLDKMIHFFNQINSNQSYIELPIHYNNHQTAELYILHKKRSHKESQISGTTVFLSLQTIHLGRFETLVNLKEKKLKIYIGLENENLINFVKNNYNLIYELIEKTEYQIIDIKCKKSTKKITPLNVEEKINEEFMEKSTSIDLKV
jgi:hypothetical protein